MQPRALLGTGDGQAPALLMAHVASDAVAAGELAYLANVLLAGCTVRGRAFSAGEASAAAAATCNVGLEHWPVGWREQDLVTAFQVGWQVLLREVSLPAARHLHAALGTLTCRDRLLQLRLAHLRSRIARAIADDAPSRVGDALDAMLPLDAAVWAGVAALLDECPVLHAAVREPRAAQAIGVDDFRFFSSAADIAVARAFIRAIPELLSNR